MSNTITLDQYLTAKSIVDDYSEQCQIEAEQLCSIVDKDLKQITNHISIYLSFEYDEVKGIVNYSVFTNKMFTYNGRLNNQIKTVLDKHSVTAIIIDSSLTPKHS